MINESFNFIYIFNDVIGERIQCEVIYVDLGSDFVFFYCQYVVNGVYCLQLCDNVQLILIGM